MNNQITDDEAVEPAAIEPTRDPIAVFDHVPDDGAEQPQYFVVESAFYAHTSAGRLRIPLFFKTKKLRSMPDGIDLLEQVYFMFDESTELIAALDELDITESRKVALKLFTAYQEKQQAQLGE